MQSTSKVIMGATLVMVVSLTIILGLVLVLLAELYCSLLLRRRSRLQLQIPPPLTAATSAEGTSTVTNTTTSPSNQHKSPLASFYLHGVLLHAPRNILFPMISPQPSENYGDFSKIHQSTDIESQERSTINDKLACSEDHYHDEQINFVYISNPIYDNNTSRPINDGEDSAATTPFQTPNSSPSGLLEGGSHCSSSSPSCSCEDVEGSYSSPSLSPMKKLPAEACSVSLGISAGTSDSNSANNDATLSSSSSSSTSPCTSPSW